MRFSSRGIRPRRRRGHGVAVPEEEEEDEERQRQAAHDSERTEQHVAAAGEQKLDPFAGALDHPRPNLLPVDVKMFLGPPHRAADDRQLHEILRPPDLVLARRIRQAVPELDRLAREGNHSDRYGRGDSERHAERQDRGREALPPSDGLPRAAIERKEHEGEEKRPVDRGEERLEDAEDEEGQQGHDGESEDPGREPVGLLHGCLPRGC